MKRKFVSPLAAEFDGFLTFKRALGCPYHRGEHLLRAFDRFMAEHHSHSTAAALEDAMRAFLARNSRRKPVSVANECGVLRQFCIYRRRSRPSAFVPGRSWTPQSTASDFLPHVLTKAQVLAVLHAAKGLRPRFLAHLYRALLLVLYCTGVRFGEAVRLRLSDVDLDKGVLLIAPSKGRSRWVPFHRSLARELRTYLVARRALRGMRPDDRFFVRDGGRPLPTNRASDGVRALLRSAGLKPPAGRMGPRPYDLRHTFAVHRLERWYRVGIDVPTRLPWLSAYMGHDDILWTETYLTATPQLLAMAARRLRRGFSAPRATS
jgi:integrase/recombinase XerD